MDPVIGSSLIGAGGRLLGGLLGRGEKALSPRRAILSHVRGATQAADKFGLHPLAILGSAGGATYSPATPSQLPQAIGDAAADLSQTLGQEAVARRQMREQKPINDKNEQLLDAQIAEARSRTLLNRANAQRAVVGPGAPHDPYAIRHENALIKVKMENGDEIYMPNPDVYEISPGEMVTTRTGMEASRAGKKVYDRHQTLEQPNTADSVSGAGVGGSRGSRRY